MKGIGGIAIIIRTELTANIKEVTKCNERLMYMRIQTEKDTNNILLMNSYAPHMGYKADIRKKYWTEIKDAIQKKKGKECIIWATDNNGQISRDIKETEQGEKGKNEDEDDETIEQKKKTIGNWTYSKKTEKGNGEKLKKYSIKHNLWVTNTPFIPKKK